MRVVEMRVSSKMLAKILGGHPMSELTSDMPADAEIVGASWDWGTRWITLIVHSESFSDVAEGAVPPSWLPTYKVRYTNALEDLVNWVNEDRKGVVDA